MLYSLNALQDKINFTSKGKNEKNGKCENMKKKLGPTTKFAWDKNWAIEWNVPRKVSLEGENETKTYYDHNLVIAFDLQDPDGISLKEESRAITILTTSEMLTIEERLNILTSRKTRKEIIENLVRGKEELAGYKMETR